MIDYVLSCCSTADMSDEYFTQRNIPYACFHYHIDGEEYPDDCGKTMPFDVFYKRVSDGAMPTTSQVNVGQYVDLFEPTLKEGGDVIHVALSSGMSGTYNSACIARDELAAKYPDRKIYIVDSLCGSSGYGLLMDMAADLRDNGASVDELRAWLEENKLNIHHLVLPSDLTHLKRGGRISATAAVFGTILNISPLIDVNHEGKLIARKKIRGRKQAIAEIVNRMETLAKDGLDYSGKCFVAHSACYEEARAVADIIESKFKKLNGKAVINSLGAVIGSHTGPATVVIFFYGDKRVG